MPAASRPAPSLRPTRSSPPAGPRPSWASRTRRWASRPASRRWPRSSAPAASPSLAEILRSRAFHTVAISASAVVRKSPSRFNPKGGFDRGFDVFQEDCVWQHADCVNRQATPHLRQGEKPLFLYLHYIDPHGPYRPPDTWQHRFAKGSPEKEWVRKGDPNPIGDWLYKGEPNPGLTPGDLQYLRDLYDEEVAYFDSQFAALLGSLRAAGLLDDSLVILTADHGEELLEHGDVKHCRNLFDPSAPVRLLVRIQGSRGRRSPGPSRISTWYPRS